MQIKIEHMKYVSIYKLLINNNILTTLGATGKIRTKETEIIIVGVLLGIG